MDGLHKVVESRKADWHPPVGILRDIFAGAKETDGWKGMDEGRGRSEALTVGGNKSPDVSLVKGPGSNMMRVSS